MCSCPRISGEVVYRSVDGRLRGPRFWWGASASSGSDLARNMKAASGMAGTLVRFSAFVRHFVFRMSR